MVNLTGTEGGAASSTVLSDREAIRDLANRYAHHVWRGEVAEVVALFAVDGVLETAAMPPFRGHEALLDAFGRMLEEDEFCPFVHNHVIELDGEVASGTCYIDLRAVMRGEQLTAWGFYEDRYVRVDGAWKFAARKVNMSSFVKLGEPLTENPQRTWEE